MIPRHLAPRIRSLLKQFKVLVLTGPRQTGKTTLLRSLLPQHRYVTLDLPQDAETAEHAPSEFLGRNPAPLLVDEVQYAPGLFRHLKAVVDASTAKGQFVLTGSQRFMLMKEVSESLSGRAAIVELHGLSAGELGPLLDTRLDAERVAGVLARGTWPALWAEAELSSADFYRSYVATWLERDLRQLLNVGSLRDFERFLRACAARSAQLLNKAELARDVGVSLGTITQWLSVLEASGLVLILEPYFTNHTSRLVKTPKLYFTDTGLLTFLLGLDANSLSTWAGLGAVWETWVIGEALRWRDTFRPEATLWFYRDKDGVETDLVIDAGGTLDLFDAKVTELPDPSAAKALLTTAEKLGKRAGRRALVTPTRKAYVTKSFEVLSGFHLDDALRR